MTETHISFIFFVGEFVYKVKKPVDHGFLDFTALEKRRYYCERKVALNRRISPDAYIGGESCWGGCAYTQQEFGVNAREEFRLRLSHIVIAARNQDDREHDVFDSDDYMQYHGGMIANVRALTGPNPRQFFGDSSDPSRSRVRDLQDEARRRKSWRSCASFTSI